jgi:drug/metabolite transporter (DMT)-like permease
MGSFVASSSPSTSGRAISAASDAAVEQGSRHRLLLVLALTTVYVVWGSTYLAIRVMVETIPPLLGAGIRFLVAGAIAWMWIAVRPGGRRTQITRAQLLGAAVIGLLLLLGGNGLVTVAEQEVPSGLAALIIAAVPLWVVVLRLVARERVSRITLAGVSVGFAGVAVLVGPGERPGDAALWGLLTLLVAGFLWALGSFLASRVPLPSEAFVASALQMLVYLILAGLGAFTAYAWLLQNAPLSTVATYAYVNPIVALFLGWLILSEPITTTVLLATLLIVASVAFVIRTEAPRGGAV